MSVFGGWAWAGGPWGPVGGASGLTGEGRLTRAPLARTCWDCSASPDSSSCSYTTPSAASGRPGSPPAFAPRTGKLPPHPAPGPPPPLWALLLKRGSLGQPCRHHQEPRAAESARGMCRGGVGSRQPLLGVSSGKRPCDREGPGPSEKGRRSVWRRGHGAQGRHAPMPGRRVAGRAAMRARVPASSTALQWRGPPRGGAGERDTGGAPR